MQAVSELYDAKLYDEVIENGQLLFDVCSASPLLNYYISKAYQGKGNADKARYYMQIATRNSQYMEVDPDLLEKMWEDRFYMEHPDLSPEAIASLKTDNVQLQALSQNGDGIKPLLWTGVGIASAGVVAVAAGATLVALFKSEGVEFKSQGASIKARASGKYIAGWTLLGTGIAATVAGCIVSGVAGSFLSKSTSDASISMDISPLGAGMTVVF